MKELSEKRTKDDATRTDEMSQFKKRVILSTVLLCLFCLIISMGRSVLIGFIILLTILVFSEILKVLLRRNRRRIKKKNKKEQTDRTDRTAQTEHSADILPTSFFWLCFISISLLRYGRMVFPWRTPMVKQVLIPIQFLWIGWFIYLLKGRSYKAKIFHMSVVIVSAAGLIECAEAAINNVNRSVFWFVFPCILVGVNDTSAYLVGKLFGQTPLLELSPNKTVEGFLGGGFFTILLSIPISKSISYITDWNKSASNLDSIILGVIASFIAPVGGVIASSYKRAFRVKDFSRLLPGHGGVADRIDCQLIMQLVTNLYLIRIIRRPTVRVFLDEIGSTLTVEERISLIRLLVEQIKRSR